MSNFIIKSVVVAVAVEIAVLVQFILMNLKIVFDFIVDCFHANHYPQMDYVIQNHYSYLLFIVSF